MGSLEALMGGSTNECAIILESDNQSVTCSGENQYFFELAIPGQSASRHVGIKMVPESMKSKHLPFSSDTLKWECRELVLVS